MIARPLRFLVSGVILAFASGAHAQQDLPNPWYAAFNVGATWNSSLSLSGLGSIRLDNPGLNLSGALGRYLDDIRVFRLEAEYIYNRSEIENFSGAAASGDFSNSSFMFNAYYDIRTGTPWTPYLGGGLGAAFLTLEDFVSGALAIDDSDNLAFAWQFKAGVTYQLSPTWTANVGYRLYGTDNVTFTTSTGASAGTSGGALTQSAEVGFRFHF